MKPEEKKESVSILKKLLALITPAPIVGLVIELEGGQKVSAPVEDSSKLVKGTPVFTVDGDGNETQVSVEDKDYKTLDGIKFTVAGGVLAEDAMAAEPAEDAPADDNADESIAAMLKELLAAFQANKPVTAPQVAEMVKAEIVELKKTIKTSFVPPGKKSGTNAEDVAEWERSFKANEHMAMKRDTPERYQQLFFAKYGKMPNM